MALDARYDPSFDLTKLNYAEENNDPSIIGSVAAGIATGLIRIPQGAASLFASIYDITNDTNTAQGVEEWFDENIYSKRVLENSLVVMTRGLTMRARIL